MTFCKNLIGLCLFAAVVAGSHYDRYSPSYHHNYKKTVKLHKLCSWNVVSYAPGYDIDRDDSWVDSGRGLIPENNIPVGFSINDDGRVFVTFPKNRLGVGSNLAYFHLDDIKNEQCPPLVPYPPRANYSLDAKCCSPDNLVNINRITRDSCSRLWGVDRNGLLLNDKVWEHGSPALVVFDLKTDNLVRRVPIPAEFYTKNQLGLNAITINVDPKDCHNAYAYISDSDNGCIVVYSFKLDKFWKLCTPEFLTHGKYTKLNVKTRKNTDVTYWKTNFLTDCTRNVRDQELVCTSDSSLYFYSVPFADLNSEQAAKCYPSENVRILGKKCETCQGTTLNLNGENQVVWQAQEQNYGVACWNRDNPLTPETVHIVVSDHQRLPYVSDQKVTTVDLSKFKDNDNHYHDTKYGYQYSHNDGNYVVVLSNNYQSIKNDGFDHKEENFGFYFFVEKEALEANPQCLAKSYKHPSYDHPYRHHQGYSYKPQTYHPPSYQKHQQPQSYQQYHPASANRQTHVYKEPEVSSGCGKPNPVAVYVEPKPEYRPAYGRTYRNTNSN